MKSTKKTIYLFAYLITLLSLTSCSYSKTTVTLGSAFDSTWPFSNENSYDYDENLVEVVNGKAQLKPLDLEHSGDDFNNGTHVGTHLDNNSFKLLNSDTDYYEFSNIFPDKANKLSAYWRFENMLTSTSSAVTHTLTSSNPTYEASPFGSFSGQATEALSTYLIRDHPDFDENLSSGFTISFWVKFESSGSSHRFLSKACYDGTAWTNSSYMFSRHGGKNLEFSIFDNGTVKSNISGIIHEIDSWVHLLAVFDGSTAEFYINGVSQGQTSISNFHDSTTDLLLSGRLGNFDCSVQTQNRSSEFDEVIILQEALSSQEVEKLYRYQSQNYNELSSDWTPKWDSIVGYWKMDGNWLDSSGNENHGTPINNPTFINNGKVGSHHMYSASVFPGDGGHVSIGNDSSLNTTSLVTQMAWVKADSFGESGAIIRNGNSTDLQYSMYVNSATGRLQFHWYDGTFNSVFSTKTLSLGVWHHIAIVRDGSNNIQFYIDGKFDSEVIATPEIGGGGFVYIGSSPGVEQDFDGSIDELAVWDINLSKFDIKTIYNRQKQKYASHYDSKVVDLGSTTANWPDLSWSINLPFGKELVGDFNNDGNPDSESLSDYPSLSGDLSSGLIAYWPMNEPSGTSGVSSSVDTISGLNGTPDTVTYGENGILANAGVFNGTSSKITLPSGNLILPGDTSFSFSAWFKTPKLYSSDPNAGARILTLTRAAGSTKAAIGISGNNINGVMVCGNYCILKAEITGIKVDDNQWHHVVGTYDMNTNIMTAYFDGGHKVTQNVGTLHNASSDASYIGAGTPGDRHYLDGSIDEVAIWDRALTDNEVLQLYRRGANRVKLQVKSCIDAACACKSYGVGGSETDCDGDTILNVADNDDIHKSEFIGPGGDGTTFYTELFNKTNTDITFNCALNTSDSNAGVCVEDEIILAGSSKPTGPEFLNIDYTQFVNPSPNRYAQYRIYMEADENTACNGEPCLPELTSVSLNPTGTIKYSSEYTEIKPKAPITFTKLFSIKIDAESCVSFRLSRGGTDYYFDSGSWQVVADITHRNNKTDVENNILEFENQFGTGELEVKAYLQSDPSQSTNCSLNDVDIRYK